MKNITENFYSKHNRLIEQYDALILKHFQNENLKIDNSQTEKQIVHCINKISKSSQTLSAFGTW